MTASLDSLIETLREHDADDYYLLIDNTSQLLPATDKDLISERVSDLVRRCHEEDIDLTYTVEIYGDRICG